MRRNAFRPVSWSLRSPFLSPPRRPSPRRRRPPTRSRRRAGASRRSHSPRSRPGVDYTLPTEGDVKAVLDRIREHFERSTPYAVIDTETGAPITDLGKPRKSGGHRQPQGRVQRLDLLDGGRPRRDAPGRGRHRRRALRRLHAEGLRLHLRPPRLLPGAGEGVRAAEGRLSAPPRHARAGRLRRHRRRAREGVREEEGPALPRGDRPRRRAHREEAAAPPRRDALPARGRSPSRSGSTTRT